MLLSAASLLFYSNASIPLFKFKSLPVSCVFADFDIPCSLSIVHPSVVLTFLACTSSGVEGFFLLPFRYCRVLINIMAAIHSLLNPLPESESHAFQLPSPSPSTHDTGFSSPTYSRKKQKLCKDAAVFVKGKIHGECRYPAYEDHDEFLAVYHQQHEIRPLGRIMEYPRHVPYNSEKKAFLQKTQRDGFEGMQCLPVVGGLTLTSS